MAARGVRGINLERQSKDPRRDLDREAHRLRVALAAVDGFSRWIQQADQKAGFMAAGAGVLLAAVGAAQRQLAYSLHPRTYLALASLIVLAGLAALLLITGALIGRVLVPRSTSSLTNLWYFGAVSRLPRSDYARELFALEDAAEELVLQAWDLATIAQVKHASARSAIYSFGASVFVFASWLIVASVGLPAPP
jgi:hypothetical protein